METKYCPLHCHSIYSFFDGLMTPQELVKLVKKTGANGVALTDHGSVGGLPAFHRACKDNDMKALLGCEFYLTMDETGNLKINDNYHLVIIAKNMTGYENIVKLNNYAVKENFYYKPRITLDKLKEHSEGLICSSACLGGPIASNFRRGESDVAYDMARRLQNIFNNDFYVELQFNELEEQRKVNALMLNMCKKSGYNFIVSNDIHYRNQADFDTYRYIFCLKYGTLEKAKAELVKRGEEMGWGGKELFVKDKRRIETDAKKYRSNISKADLETAIENTQKIVDKVEHIEFNKELKMFDMGYENVEQEFKRRVFAGFKKRIRNGFIDIKKTDKYLDRLKMEVNVIIENGFSSYMVLVSDVVDYITGRGISIGPGRGSAVGCLASYCMYVTHVDPVKYELYFERFINPERVSLPDIDIDYSDRNKACELLVEKYGDKVVKIGTFSQLASRSAVLQAFKFLSVPTTEYGITKTFDKKGIAYELKHNELVKNFYNKNDTQKNAFKFAVQLENKIKNYGTHASGVAILPHKNAVPLARVKNSEFVTAYDGNELEKLGYLKLDVLGLSNLPALIQTCEMVGIKYEDLYKLDFEADDAVFEEFGKGHTVGVFQMENTNTTSILGKIGKLKTFMDLPLLISIIRPNLDVEGFVKNYLSKKDDFYMPYTEDILKESYGIIVYQEEVMRLCRDIAGMTMGGADKVRKAIAKTQKEGVNVDIKAYRFDFIRGAISNGYEKDKVEKLWNKIEDCGNYIFNKSHATAYAMIAYFCMYLKTHYPLEFLISCMNKIDNHPKYFYEAKRIGIEFLPIDINKSSYDHTVEDGKIRLGMGCIKGVNLGYKIINEMRPIKSFDDFIRKTKKYKLSKDIVETIITIGVFDDFVNRPTALMLFEGHRETIITEDCFDVFKKLDKQEQDAKKLPDWDEDKKRKVEIELYNYSLKSHPVEKFKPYIETKRKRGFNWATTTDLKDQTGQWIVVGEIVELNHSTTKAGKPFIWCFLDDGITKVRFPIWDNDLKTLSDNELKCGNIIAVKLKQEVNAKGYMNLSTWKKSYNNRKEKILQILT